MAKQNKEVSDKKVQKMIETWDEVTCYRCKKKISLLNAKESPDGKHFICKKGC